MDRFHPALHPSGSAPGSLSNKFPMELPLETEAVLQRTVDLLASGGDVNPYQSKTLTREGDTSDVWRSARTDGLWADWRSTICICRPRLWHQDMPTRNVLAGCCSLWFIGTWRYWWTSGTTMRTTCFGCANWWKPLPPTSWPRRLLKPMLAVWATQCWWFATPWRPIGRPI